MLDVILNFYISLQFRISKIKFRCLLALQLQNIDMSRLPKSGRILTGNTVKQTSNRQEDDASIQKSHQQKQRRKTTQKLEIITVEQTTHWNIIEQTRYINFLVKNHKWLRQNADSKKKIGKYTLMSKSVIVREPFQCRSHHQKMLTKHHSIEGIIENHRSLLKQQKALQSDPVDESEVMSFKKDSLRPIISTFLPVFFKIDEEEDSKDFPQSEEDDIDYVGKFIDLNLIKPSNFPTIFTGDQQPTQNFHLEFEVNQNIYRT